MGDVKRTLFSRKKALIRAINQGLLCQAKVLIVKSPQSKLCYTTAVILRTPTLQSHQMLDSIKVRVRHEQFMHDGSYLGRL